MAGITGFAEVAGIARQLASKTTRATTKTTTKITTEACLFAVGLTCFSSGLFADTTVSFSAGNGCGADIFRITCSIDGDQLTCESRGPQFFCSVSTGDRSTTAPEPLTHIWFADEGDHASWVASGEVHFQVCATGASAAEYCWDSASYWPGSIYGYTALYPADLDEDGVPNINDAFPLDPSESLDTDGDGIGNNSDGDDDGDGTVDSVDAEPLNAGNNNEVSMSLNAGYKGLKVKQQ